MNVVQLRILPGHPDRNEKAGHPGNTKRKEQRDMKKLDRSGNLDDI